MNVSAMEEELLKKNRISLPQEQKQIGRLRTLDGGQSCCRRSSMGKYDKSKSQQWDMEHVLLHLTSASISVWLSRDEGE